MRRMIVVVSALSFFVAIVWLPSFSFAQDTYDRTAFAADQVRGEELARKISTIEVLAPLAPVALSPFFGITCLSGLSILGGGENALLAGNPVLDNGLVFIIFLALSIATSLPKMTAVSKGFAEVADQLETYAGIITYLVIFYLAGAGRDNGGQEQVVYAAGIFTFTRDTLLMIAVVINIIVINTIKFFLELLVWISPVPGLDAAFETANKAITAALVAVYAFNAWLAMLINVVLFLICLANFNWVSRRVRYLRTILVGPITARLLGRSGFSPSYRLKSKIAAAVEGGEPLLNVFPARKIRKIKKKEMSYLTAARDGLFLVKVRLIRRPKVEKLAAKDAQIEVITGLLSNTIEIASEETAKPAKLVFSRVHNRRLDSIATALKPFGRIRTESIAHDGHAPATSPPHPGLA